MTTERRVIKGICNKCNAPVFSEGHRPGCEPTPRLVARKRITPAMVKRLKDIVVFGHSLSREQLSAGIDRWAAEENERS